MDRVSRGVHGPGVSVFGSPVCMGSRPSLVVADPELSKQIMIKDFSNFRNRFIPINLHPSFSKSVATARDDTWKRIRNTLTPTFSAGKMKLMVPLIEKSCDTLMHKLEKLLIQVSDRYPVNGRVPPRGTPYNLTGVLVVGGKIHELVPLRVR